MIVNIEKIERLDLADLRSLSQKDLETMIRCSKRTAFLWRGTVDGKLACLLGLVPPSLLSNQAYIWLYTTDLVHEHQFSFVRYSQLVVAKMLEQYDTLIGHASVDAEKSIRWLKWLGAKFGEPKEKLIPFVIGRSDG